MKSLNDMQCHSDAISDFLGQHYLCKSYFVILWLVIMDISIDSFIYLFVFVTEKTILSVIF